MTGTTATSNVSPLSTEIRDWLEGTGEKTLGSLADTFGARSFALLFVLLLGVPALPLPTGGVTHVFEIVAMLVALELVLGRDRIWLPRRWRQIELTGPRRERFVTSLTKLIRRLERISRPRLRFLFNHSLTNRAFGLFVLCGSLGAFLAPPFSGLDTLPALGVVVLSLALLLEDAVLVFAAVLMGAAGVALEVVLGEAAVNGIGSLI
jgi:hypothetical protein